MIDLDFNNIPEELKKVPNWVCWRKETRDGKDTKIPVNPQSGKYAKTNDPETWGPFDRAQIYYQNNNNGRGIAGIGFVLSKNDSIAGIDIDKCRDPETGKIEPWAIDIIKKLNSYTEVSPSGTGIRIFIKGRFPKGGCKRGDLPDYSGGNKGGLEVYDRSRYMTVTGDHLEEAPPTIGERQAELDQLLTEYFSPKEKKTNRTSGSNLLSDDEVINKAKSARNGDRFARLYNGDHSEYPSSSEADLAICGMIAFYTGNNPEQIDRIFRSSELFRDKWDQKHYTDGRTYGQRVIEKAISGSRETYIPNHKTTDFLSTLESSKKVVTNILQSQNLKDSMINAMKSPETLDSFVLVADQDPGLYQATLAEMQTKGLSGRFLTDFNKLIKDRLKKSKEQSQKDSPQYKKAGDMLPDCNCPYPTLLIPSHYSLDLNGIFTFPDHDLIAYSPILITARLRDVEEGTEFFRLAWRRSHRWLETIVDRGIALDGKKLIQLASTGFPVAGNIAAKISTYLNDLEAINLDSLPFARISNHMGWQGKNEKEGFLWGRKLISRDGSITADLSIENLSPEDWKEDWIAFKGIASGDEQIADGYNSSGTFEDWKKIIKPLEDYPRALTGVYASFVPPLLKILNIPNFVIDFANRTSTGKTTILKIAASVWGLPDEKGDGSMSSWDATKVWLERASAILNGIPLILDDTKRAKNPKLVAEMIYSVVQGRGRGRGNTQSLAKTRTWRTVLISNGEAPATSFTEDGGTRTRTMEVRGAPFVKDDDETRRLVTQINNQIVINYGHAGPAFVSFLLKNREKWEDYRSKYLELVEQYAEAAGTTEGGRLAQGFAALHLAEILTFEAGITPWEYAERIKEVWQAIAAEAVDAAGEVRALLDIMSWANANEHRFYGRHFVDKDGDPKLPSGGYAGKWDKGEKWIEIAFYPTVLKKELENLGYTPEAILAGWKERKWLRIRDGEKGYTTQRYIRSEKKRLIVIDRSAIDKGEANRSR